MLSPGIVLKEFFLMDVVPTEAFLPVRRKRPVACKTVPTYSSVTFYCLGRWSLVREESKTLPIGWCKHQGTSFGCIFAFVIFDSCSLISSDNVIPKGTWSSLHTHLLAWGSLQKHKVENQSQVRVALVRRDTHHTLEQIDVMLSPFCICNIFPAMNICSFYNQKNKSI